MWTTAPIKLGITSFWKIKVRVLKYLSGHNERDQTSYKPKSQKDERGVKRFSQIKENLDAT